MNVTAIYEKKGQRCDPGNGKLVSLTSQIAMEIVWKNHSASFDQVSGGSKWNCWGTFGKGSETRSFSVIGPRLWNSPPWYPKLIFSTNIPFQTQNTPLQNCVPSLGSFPSPWTVYPDFDSCYFHFMPYRMTPSVRHRAIEVHYYYYYYYYYWNSWIRLQIM